MGTNFYWLPAFCESADQPCSRDSILSHIGRRSAAGLYCQECGIARCRHTCDLHKNIPQDNTNFWFQVCPGCGAPFQLRERVDTATGVTAAPQTGVVLVCSFTWTMLRHKKRLQAMVFDEDTRACVKDEYGSIYTAEEFLTEELCHVIQEWQSATEFC